MLIAFESHPIQYRAPLFREIERLCPGKLEVVYFSDSSIRGYRDAGFGVEVRWNVPLLEGYRDLMVGSQGDAHSAGLRGLTGKGVFKYLRRRRPTAVLFSQFAHRFELSAYLTCIVLGIPIWIRQETQDEAYHRGWAKQLLRRLLYRIAYLKVTRAFYIGELNREHLLRHGIKRSRLVRAPYAAVDHYAGWGRADKLRSREQLREKLGIGSSAVVIGFFGKLIPKKQPDLLLEAWAHLPANLRERVHLLVIGAGSLEAEMRARAQAEGIRSTFAGFVNQAEIGQYYLAADIVVLPSRKMGETWGLVVNEALSAGCGVVITNAVGCHREFGGWERVRVIPVGNAAACARAITELSGFSRDFDWSRTLMENYSMEESAAAIGRLVT